jgi:phosphomannomutase / phosphoglucomutase
LDTLVNIKQQTIVNHGIFRANDIRGIVDVTLTVETVELIGRAIGSTICENKQPVIVIGRDGRLSGTKLIQALKLGLTSTGCSVIDLGEIPTPLMYYATKKLSIPNGIILTGSHNPKDYNGLKIIIDHQAIQGNAIQKLYNKIIQQDFVYGIGSVCTQSIDLDYISEVKQRVPLSRPLKIVVDCGNGVTGNIAPLLYTELGCKVIPLFCNIDGNFPNHHPDPGDPHNLEDLINKVIEEKADLGLAFDGDGDRLGIVDNNGKMIFPDRLLMLLAKDLLINKPNATIIYDVKCSSDLETIIRQYLGNPIMWKTGHAFIKAKMLETNAMLAGEMSGHIYFTENWYGFDDALYSGARLLQILTKSTEQSSRIFSAIPERVATPEITLDVTEENKFDILEAMKAHANFKDVQDISTIDGIRVTFTDGWGLIRPSNTTPKLVARFEAESKIALNRIQAAFKELLLLVEPAIVVPF